jgi:ketosteroid isomerase-like protein
MKTIHVFSLLAITGLFFSSCCSKTNNHASKANTVNIDSLENAWNKAWNAHDERSLENQVAADCAIGSILGKDSVIANYIRYNVPGTKSLKTVAIRDGNSEGMAYRIGKFEMQFVSDEGKMIDEQGTYIIIWKKQEDNTWKVAVLRTNK